MDELPLIGLVAMVKNEQAIITRMLSGALQVCDHFTICDTGSTDDTRKLAKAMLFGRSGGVYRQRWANFGASLTTAHKRARGTARWLLWQHADMIPHCYPDFRAWLAEQPHTGPEALDAYMVEVEESGGRYRLPLLMRGDLPFKYVGKTHEFLRLPGKDAVEVQNVYGIGVLHLADGANRDDKHLRDIALLQDDFRKRDPRAIFYTAQAHECLGNIEQAAMIYELRATLEGYGEEKWLARYRAAKLREDIEELFECWRERPHRHEPLTAAARIVGRVEHQDSLFLEQPII